MKKKKRLQKELEIFKQALKYLEKGYGKKPCKFPNPSCANCQAMWAIGWLYEHLDLLKWE